MKYLELYKVLPLCFTQNSRRNGLGKCQTVKQEARILSESTGPILENMPEFLSLSPSFEGRRTTSCCNSPNALTCYPRQLQLNSLLLYYLSAVSCSTTLCRLAGLLSSPRAESPAGAVCACSEEPSCIPLPATMCNAVGGGGV